MKKYLALLLTLLLAFACFAGCGNRSEKPDAEEVKAILMKGSGSETETTGSVIPETVYLNSTRSGAITKAANPVIGISFDVIDNNYQITKTRSNFKVDPIYGGKDPFYVMFDSPDEIVIGDFEYGFATAISTKWEDLIHVYDLKNQLVYKVVTPLDTNRIKKISDNKYVVQCGNETDGYRTYSFATSTKYAFDMFMNDRDVVMIVDGGHEYDVARELAQKAEGATTVANERTTEPEAEPSSENELQTRVISAEDENGETVYSEQSENGAFFEMFEETEAAFDQDNVDRARVVSIEEPDGAELAQLDPAYNYDSETESQALDSPADSLNSSAGQPVQNSGANDSAQNLTDVVQETIETAQNSFETIQETMGAAQQETVQTADPSGNGALTSGQNAAVAPDANTPDASVSNPVQQDQNQLEALNLKELESLSEDEIETTVIQTGNDEASGAVSDDQIYTAEEEEVPSTHTDIPGGRIVNVPLICQFPYYPTGCESVSTVMALQYHGVNISVDDFINNYLDQSIDFYMKDGLKYGPSPYEYFIGSPFDSSGFGCMAPVIYNALLKVFDYNRAKVVNVTGVPMQDLCMDYLNHDLPVMVWVNIGMADAFATNTWRLADDTEYIWLANEHCMLLVGYDENCYYFNDPFTGATVTYGKAESERCYEQQGMSAVVILD